MNPDAFRMNRLTLRFADAGLEKAFAEEQAKKSLRPIRIALVCAGALTVVIWPVAIQTAPAVQEHMPRIVVTVLAALGLCFALTHTQVFLRRHQWIMLALACALSFGMTNGIMPRYPPQILEARGFFPMVIHLFTIYGVFRLRFPAAVAGGWISMAMYLALLRALGLLSESAFFVHTSTLLAANLWGMLICYQMDLAIRRAFLAMRDVAAEHGRSERLLLNILPADLAKELSETGSARPARHESVTILFTDFSGFTQEV